MIQRREHFGFALKPGEPLDVRRQRLRQHFDRDLTLQDRVGRAIDLTHSADANVCGDLIRAKARARCQGHRFA